VCSAIVYDKVLAIKRLLEAALLEAARCQWNHQHFASPSGDSKGGLSNGSEPLGQAEVPGAEGGPSLVQEKNRTIDCHQQI